MFVYFYDVKPKKKDDYNRLKRSFYYHFNKIKLNDFSFKTKSVLMVNDRYEKLIDSFFLGFKGQVEVYKVKTDGVEQLC
ncbi:Uncharacterised protein [Candidatus Burarchaeum australiense]|nr:Uncharacterised protein [Candidatus Burarchaeum australiense]